MDYLTALRPTTAPPPVQLTPTMAAEQRVVDPNDFTPRTMVCGSAEVLEDFDYYRLGKVMAMYRDLPGRRWRMV